MNQDLTVVILFVGKMDSKLGQLICRAVGPAEPDFRGVAHGKDLAAFQGALRHTSAQDEDHVRMSQRIFALQPPARAAKCNHPHQDQHGQQGQA